jgi:hypothetical protein
LAWISLSVPKNTDEFGGSRKYRELTVKLASRGVARVRDRARERQIRRLAADCDLQLIRSWVRTKSHYGTYALIDPVRNTLVLADPESGFGMNLDDVAIFLQRRGKSRSRGAQHGGQTVPDQIPAPPA